MYRFSLTRLSLIRIPLPWSVAISDIVVYMYLLSHAIQRLLILLVIFTVALSEFGKLTLAPVSQSCPLLSNIYTYDGDKGPNDSGSDSDGSGGGSDSDSESG